MADTTDADVNTRIRDVIKAHPLGLSIKEISAAVSMSRNSVAKYLDVLTVSGQLELRHVGNAKLYTLSTRVPVDSIINQAHELIIVLDNDLRIVRASNSFFLFEGIPPESVVGSVISMLPVPFLSASEERELDLLLRGGPSLTKEIRTVRDGDEVFFSGKFIPTLLDNGVAGVTVILADVTERVRAQRAAQERERLLQTIFHIPSVPQFYIDRNHKVVYWDRALEIMTGIKAEAIVGTRDHWKAFYSLERPCLVDLVMESNKVIIAELFPDLRGKEPDGEGRYEYTGFFEIPGHGQRWLRIAAMPVRDPAGNLTGAMETVEDVTEKKEWEFRVQG